MNRELGNGLMLRALAAGYESDRRDLAAFFTEVFSEAEDEEETHIGPWAESLIAGDHPTCGAENSWVVVDSTQNDRIVSALLLIPQLWRYESIPMPVGRIEIVATHKDYRRRGLIRALMQAAHERSAALGHQVQAITGIAHYYRQFGYAMVVDLGSREAIPLATIKPRSSDSAPEISLRPAVAADIPALVAWDKYAGDRVLLSTVRSEAEWAYEFTRPSSHLWWLDILIISRTDGEDLGYIALRQKFGTGTGSWLACLAYVVGPQSSYLETYEPVLSALKTHLQNRYPNDTPAFIHFTAGINAGFSTLTKARYPASTRDQVYAWYLRIADLPRFMESIAPVLEKRLESSAAHRFTGELKLDFYELQGLRMQFEQGRLIAAETIALDTPQAANAADAHLPWHMLLALIFGYRNFEDLAYILPDCEANAKARLLFQILFPRKQSWLMPLV